MDGAKWINVTVGFRYKVGDAVHGDDKIITMDDAFKEARDAIKELGAEGLVLLGEYIDQTGEVVGVATNQSLCQQ